MPPSVDTIFGTSYLELQAFKDRAWAFGCSQAITGANDTNLVALLAMASRAIDSHVGRDFLPDTRTENHSFNLDTRRTQLNNPPVMELIEFKLQVSPTGYAVFPANAVLINNQEGYLELATLSLATSLAPSLITLGINEPQAVITYKSYQDVPKNVAAATGWIAADMANDSRLQVFLQPGLQSVSEGDVSYTRAADMLDEYAIPPRAEKLLSTFIRFTAC